MASERAQLPDRCMVDSHLTYIGAACRDATKYDVYRREGGPQLGTVTKRGRLWIAEPPVTYPSDPSQRPMVVRPTRWQAAVDLWGRD